MPAPIRFQLPNGIPVLFDRDPRWKSVLVRVVLHRPLDQNCTRASLLLRMLERGCRRAPTQGAIVRFLESLYGAGFDGEVGKVGERQLLMLSLTLLADRFVPRGSDHLARGLGFLRRVLCEPVLEGGAFRAEPLEQEKENLRRTIEAVVNDKSEYATHRMVQEMCAQEPYRRYEFGAIEDLAGIGARELAGFHARLLRRARIEIYVAGSVGPGALEAALARAFDFPHAAPAPLPEPLPGQAPPTPRLIAERAPGLEQARLVIGFRTGSTLRDSGTHALGFLNAMLGGFSHSRLFRAFREREGLAYDIHSWIERTKGLLAVETGVDDRQVEHATDLIRAAVTSFAAGEITDEEMDLTRRALLERVHALLDQPGMRLSFYLERAINGRTDLVDDLAQVVRTINRDQVIEAARRLQLDTIYVLRPEEAA